jgi:hypothetical protein
MKKELPTPAAAQLAAGPPPATLNGSGLNRPDPDRADLTDAEHSDAVMAAPWARDPEGQPLKAEPVETAEARRARETRRIPPPSVIRHDGWTLWKQQEFCRAIAQHGKVHLAAARVEMSEYGAYRFRATAKGQAFADAWDKARVLARRYLVERAMTLAMQGETQEHMVDGQTVLEKRRNSPALVLNTLERLRSKDVLGNTAALAAARDFDTCLDLLLEGIPYPAPGSKVERPSVRLLSLVPSPEEEARAEAVAAGSRARVARLDAFTPVRQREFCEALAATGNVFSAITAAYINRSAVYRLRQSKAGRAFAVAWDAALLIASERMIDGAYQMAAVGSVARIVHNNKLVAERRTSNALTVIDTFQRLTALGQGDVVAVADALDPDFDDFEASLAKLETGSELESGAGLKSAAGEDEKDTARR